jgi:hypothetical protein
VAVAMAPQRPPDQQVWGVLCVPPSRRAAVVQVLIPGGTYGHSYLGLFVLAVEQVLCSRWRDGWRPSAVAQNWPTFAASWVSKLMPSTVPLFMIVTCLCEGSVVVGQTAVRPPSTGMTAPVM